jgi:exodeoxyribonuclease V beta subunit
MADLPVGATFGSLVHAVLEHADPDAADLEAELLRHVVDQLQWWPVDVDPAALAAALAAVNDSPLGPLAGEVSLRQVRLADRLRELDFELPLSGGDVGGYATGEVTLGDLAPILRRHLPPGDPVGRFADHLETNAALADQPLRGYLTGSIDVVMRVEVEGVTRYLTVDYKTNWLGDLAGPLTAHEYRPAALDEAMGHSDYPLQALLYTVVLHRYLRWRLTDYDPTTHLGGVLYLYLRGMCGGQTPRVDGQPCGVFSWRPPVGLVTELSDLLDGQPPGSEHPAAPHPAEEVTQ